MATKRKTHFNVDWIVDFPHAKKSTQSDHHAFCSICRCDVDIGHKGKKDLEQHDGTAKHKLSVKSHATQGNLNSFFTPAVSLHSEKVTATELCKVYHTVKHHHSYRSQDCGTRVDREVFKDSAVAKDITCGKTKTQAISLNILAPYSVQAHLEYIKSNDLYYSLATDASNKGTTKCFPLVLRYFNYDTGVQNLLLDFYEDKDETSQAIATQIFTRLDQFNLPLNRMTSYSADNASVNYGKHNSVFQKLKEAQSDILAANCNTHIMHNSTKYAAAQLSIDVENIILKIFAHFSMSAKRTGALDDFFDFVEMEHRNVLRHVVTRWLSLLPAVDRVLLIWPALQSYFKSIDPKECHKVILECFVNEKTSPTTEAYLFFVSHMMTIFHKAILPLEAKSHSIFTAYGIMSKLMDDLERHLKDSFFGFAANNVMRGMPQAESRKCHNDFTVFLERAIKYIRERYDYSDDNLHKCVEKLSLSEPVSFADFSLAVEACKITVDVDQLYEEFGIVESVLESPKLEKCETAEDRYTTLFANFKGPCPNLKKIASYLFSIPVSNAHTERVFSMMTTAWRDERNQAGIDTIKAELQICFNFETPCKEMYELLLANKPLLKSARKQEKYKFKR